ncbi:glycosyltransferase family 2 protein [Vibrio alginolyticus]|uniref:glycosyltransferase n=1 Tax=Vibrio sp. B1FLJ16 TaxID=2751178 RepID=UPI0015F78340|nr:glycosyltransferase family A protein [Vibrio sp. B1FLJ16]CAD7797711.1 COG0463 Glycosyltransferases involved in cell wall biogenesis [Vibrio sp. B1FLJ16]CAE6880768.1 COG0463 Glycosyltransferases involved in cell wall biogenesis [Vibrio sp. B1FLJ16]
MSKILEFSIVIPYYNDELDSVLSAIDKAYLNSNNSEFIKLNVICVNNGGLMFSPSKSYSFELKLIDENEHLCSPYSARNRGVELINSGWYIFLDSTCIPALDWFDELKNFQEDRIYAANVQFYSKCKTSAGDIYDSIINIDNQKTVKQSGVAKTACLAVSSKSIETVGLFEEKIRSGGDVLWTSKSTSLGFQLVFLPNWIVSKESRNTQGLIKKQFRVSSGWYKIWKRDGTVIPNFVKRVLLFFIPPNPFQLFNTARRRKVDLSIFDKLSITLLGWFLRLVSAVGIVYGMLKK